MFPIHGFHCPPCFISSAHLEYTGQYEGLSKTSQQAVDVIYPFKSETFKSCRRVSAKNQNKKNSFGIKHSQSSQCKKRNYQASFTMLICSFSHVILSLQKTLYL